MGGRIQSVQALRFVAAAMVLWLHANEMGATLKDGDVVSRWVTIGASGVDIFFVISGMIIYQSAFTGGGHAPLEFLRLRFLRIAPLYWLLSLAWLPICSSIGDPPDWRGLASTFLFWPAFDRFAMPPLAPGWTLCFEMLFYVSTFLVLVSRWFLVALAVVAGAGAYAAARFGWAPASFVGSPLLVEFAFGVVIARTVGRDPRRPWWFGVALIIAGAVWMVRYNLPFHFLTLGIQMPAWIALGRVLAWGMPAAIMLAGALMVEPHLDAKWLWVKLAGFLGDASYSIYLAHWPLFAVVMWAVGRSGVSLPTAWLVYPLFLLGLAAGVLTYFLVEEPPKRAMKRGVLQARAA